MKNPPVSALPKKKSGAKVRFSIRTKLALYSFFIAAVTVVVVAFLAYYVSAQSLRQLRLDEFRSLRNTLTQSIVAYFSQIRSETAAEAETETVRNALHDFSTARASLVADLTANGFTPDDHFLDTISNKNTDTFNSTIVRAISDIDKSLPDPSALLPTSPEGKILQYVYISANPSSLGAKFDKNLSTDIAVNPNLQEPFRTAFSKTAYAKTMDRYHPFFSRLALRYGVSDLELIDNDANVVYSYAKRFDFATNVQTNYWKRSTELGRVYLATWCTPLPSSTTLSSDQVVNSDYTRYVPALDNPMLILGCGIPDMPDPKTQKSAICGVLIHELNSQALDKIVTFNDEAAKAGLGNSGEAYLVGPDYFARTESRFLPQLSGGQVTPVIGLDGKPAGNSAILKLQLSSDIDKLLFNPEDPTNQGDLVDTDYRGISTLSLGSPLPLPGVNWGLVTKIDTAEAFASAVELGISIAGIGSLVLLGVVLLSFATASYFSRPIVDFSEVADAIAAGDTERRANIKSGDEIGLLANRFNSMVDQLVSINQQLALRNDQTAKIMSTVREGLLLVDTEGKILPEHSNAARLIFQTPDLSGLNFLGLIDKIVPPKVYHDCKNYVDVLLDPWVEEEFVTDINPLAQLKVSLPTDNGDFETKYLEFRFKRVYGEESKITYLLITVADATERVILSEKLEAAKENTRSQLSLLLGLTHIERPRLNQFFEETDREIRDINALLKVSTSSNVETILKSVDYLDLTNTVFRGLHTIKGHARLLNLEFFELGASNLEEKVSGLRELARAGNLKGQDFIPLVVGLQEFYHELSELRRLFARLSGEIDKAPTPSIAPTKAPVAKLTVDGVSFVDAKETSRFVGELTGMVDKLAEEFNKKVEIESSEFDLSLIPERCRTAVSGVFIHLVTNSAIHGLESTAERLKAHKPEVGKIKLASYFGQDHKVWVTVEDDGRGYNLDAIRKKAMELYNVGEDYFRDWSPEEITHLVFSDGLSTADSVSRAAGRGVGLSAVRAKAEELKGSVYVRSVPGKGSTFYFSMGTNQTDFYQNPVLRRLKEFAPILK